MAKLDKASKLPPEKMVIEVAGSLASSGTFPSTESAAYFLRAQQMVLDVPNYAEIYRNYIEETARLVAANENSSGRKWDSTLIAALGNLPASQSVEVLGDYLSDTRDHKWLPGPEYNHELRGRSALAARALHDMGIKNAPTYGISYSSDTSLQVEEAWKLWYEQVKSGQRKFKFVGSDVEYSLKDLPPPAPAREARDPRQKAQSGSKDASPENGNRFDDRAVRWPWLVGLIVVFAGAVFWLRRKKGASVS